MFTGFFCAFVYFKRFWTPRNISQQSPKKTPKVPKETPKEAPKDKVEKSD